MNNETKFEIGQAAAAYMKLHGLSQKAMAELSNMNVSYINSILHADNTTEAFEGAKVIGLKEGVIEIKDNYYMQLAKAIGFEFETSFWPTLETDQYLSIYASLVDGKDTGRMKMIIGDSGCGKTFTTNKFIKDNPVGTLRITVSSLYSISDIINELCESLGLSTIGSPASKIQRIAAKLRGQKSMGQRPIVIIDEAENLRLPALKMLKSLYDGVKDFASIALIGTPTLLHKLDVLKHKNVEGMPQFYRRFKAGIREVPSIKTSQYEEFFQATNTIDEGLKTLLTTLCENFGELNDYLEPALAEAAAEGTVLNEKKFRLMNQMGRR